MAQYFNGRTAQEMKMGRGKNTNHLCLSSWTSHWASLAQHCMSAMALSLIQRTVFAIIIT